MRRTKLHTGIVIALVVALAIGWFLCSTKTDPPSLAPKNAEDASVPAARTSSPGIGRSEAKTARASNTTRAPEVASSTRTFILFGWIKSDVGDPVAGATVRVIYNHNQGSRTAQTIDDGSYVLHDLRPTIVRLEFSMDAFKSESFDAPSFPAHERVRWDVVLEKARGVYGLVVSENRPVWGARVSLGLADQHRLLASTQTDGDGRFSLDFPTGDDEGPIEGLQVAASHPQFGKASLAVDEPGPVLLELPGGGYVAGHVRAIDGAPIATFSVSASSLASDDGGPPAQSFESPDGAYRLGPISPGKQRVFVVAPGFRPSQSELLHLSPGETILDVDFSLLPSPVLRGRVIDTNTKRPIAGALVVPAEWSAEALAESVGAVTGIDGNYVLSSLPAERTTIQASATGYRSLMHGGIEGARDALVLDFALTPLHRGEAPTGEITGIGAALERTERGVVVRDLMPGGSAIGRLVAGDLIVMVDGLAASELDFPSLVQKIRGEAGTEVVLWVLRGGAGVPERVVLERRRVEVPERESPH